MSKLPKLRVIEFFSGIGGWAASLQQLYECYEQVDDYVIVQAIDINEAANAIYARNFKSQVACKSIDSLKPLYLENLKANCWCLSPPCQPFTRNNTSSTRDNNDNRTDALIHLLDILQQMRSPPQYICLENVVGFENSKCCERLLSTIQSTGYKFQEFILTPTQFGIPNERPRYYLVAVLQSINGNLCGSSDNCSKFKHKDRHVLKFLDENKLKNIATINNYLDKELDCNLHYDQYLVPENVLKKSSSWCFDICIPSDTTSACFTKSYSRYIKGTGSVLFISKDKLSLTTTNNNSDDKASISNIESNIPKDIERHSSPLDSNENYTLQTPHISKLKTSSSFEEEINQFRREPDQRIYNNNTNFTSEYGNLRFFTPNELLKLFGFPSTYSLPPLHLSQNHKSLYSDADKMSTVLEVKDKVAKNDASTEKYLSHLQFSNRKYYELIGNSLNVTVTSAVLNYILSPDHH